MSVHRTGRLLSHVCFSGSKLLLLVDFEEPGLLMGCETCLSIKLRQAPGKVCWHPVLGEICLCPNTRFCVWVYLSLLVCQSPCFSDLSSLFIAFNWADESHLRLLNE